METTISLADDIKSKLKETGRFRKHLNLSRMVLDYKTIITGLFRESPEALEKLSKVSVKVDTEEEFMDRFEDLNTLKVYVLISNELYLCGENLYRRKGEEKNCIIVKEIDDNYIQNGTDTLNKNFKVMKKFLRAQIS
ncbi:hypothetical protein HN375_01835 [bacterium]|nr:hypothetical protein [bacterium]